MKSEEYMNEDYAYIVLNDIAVDLVLKRKWTTRCIDDHVFLDEDGNPVNNINCYAYRVARTRVAEQYPEIMQTDVHSFKRTFITRLIDKGVPYDWVQRLANHKLPEVTETYNRMNPEKRRMMHQYLQMLVEDRPQLKLYSMNRG
jgi:integrase